MTSESTDESVIQPQGVMNGIGYRIEIRTWFVGGKYLGRQSPFVLCDTVDLAERLTGDFAGVEIIRNAVDAETSRREAMVSNGNSPATGEITPYPIKLDDWGEYRVVTLGVAK